MKLKGQNIFLVGPMGAGKTSVGRALARELNCDFFDTDQEIESQTGVDVAWIFDVEGEQGFRDRETEMLEQLSEKQNIVLATGGGIIERAENRKLLSARGMVIYLQASVNQQLKRMVKDSRRPLLQTPDREQRLKTLSQKRIPLYEEIADSSFDTNSMTVKSVVSEILKGL